VFLLKNGLNEEDLGGWKYFKIKCPLVESSLGNSVSVFINFSESLASDPVDVIYINKYPELFVK